MRVDRSAAEEHGFPKHGDRGQRGGYESASAECRYVVRRWFVSREAAGPWFQGGVILDDNGAKKVDQRDHRTRARIAAIECLHRRPHLKHAHGGENAAEIESDSLARGADSGGKKLRQIERQPFVKGRCHEAGQQRHSEERGVIVLDGAEQHCADDRGAQAEQRVIAAAFQAAALFRARSVASAANIANAVITLQRSRALSSAECSISRPMAS